MKKIILPCLLLLTTFLFSCQKYGKKIEINDKLDVYILKDATEEDGRKLGDFLASIDTSTGGEKKVQLKRENDLYTVRMVVDEATAKNAAMLPSFQLLHYMLEQNVFGGKSVRLILSDEHFVDLKTVDTKATTPSTDDPAINPAPKIDSSTQDGPGNPGNTGTGSGR